MKHAIVPADLKQEVQEVVYQIGATRTKRTTGDVPDLGLAVPATGTIAGTLKITSKGTVKANVPSANTKVIATPEVKAPTTIKASDVTKRWEEYLGPNTTNINPRTGKVDSDRIFSADGKRSVRFSNHEMTSSGTPKYHYHEETWTYDSVNDTMTVTNTLQRIK